MPEGHEDELRQGDGWYACSGRVSDGVMKISSGSVPEGCLFRQGARGSVCSGRVPEGHEDEFQHDVGKFQNKMLFDNNLNVSKTTLMQEHTKVFK